MQSILTCCRAEQLRNWKIQCLVNIDCGQGKRQVLRGIPYGTIRVKYSDYHSTVPVKAHFMVIQSRHHPSQVILVCYRCGNSPGLCCRRSIIARSQTHLHWGLLGNLHTFLNLFRKCNYGSAFYLPVFFCCDIGVRWQS